MAFELKRVVDGREAGSDPGADRRGRSSLAAPQYFMLSCALDFGGVDFGKNKTFPG